MASQKPVERKAGRPTRERAAEIERAVVRGARNVFRDRGPLASMDDVAAAVGVSKLTIYRRFPSKEDLLLAVIDHDLDDLFGKLDAAIDPARTAIDNLHAAARTAFEFMVDADNVPVARAFIRDVYDCANMR
jgi:TetR/AcrR family transcriptional regulator, mexJK operon transcriptional repressor